jgi:hypothetical protein
MTGCVALFALARLSVAGDVSYVVLHRPNYEGLVRVSGDGSSRTTIARGVGGFGLAVDERGDYIVANASSLVRVTPLGVAGNIAAAPGGSQWLGVAVDATGNYILADNRQHAVWRVSQDGRIVDKVAIYTDQSKELEDVAVIVDRAGDYLLMEDHSFAAHFWLITPAGNVAPIPLHGDRITSCTSMVGDGAGAYLVASYREGAVFRVTSSGDVTKFADIPGRRCLGLARNPETGELVTDVGLDPSVLWRIGANGSPVTQFATEGYVTAIIAESGAVSATGR